MFQEEKLFLGTREVLLEMLWRQGKEVKRVDFMCLYKIF